jgi:hypothetical protein
VHKDALDHLMAIVHAGEQPDPARLDEEFIYRKDFASWLDWHGDAQLEFWFPSDVDSVSRSG